MQVLQYSSGATRISFRRGQSSGSGPLQTQSGPLKSQSGIYKARASPFKARAGPTKTRAGPCKARVGPSKARAGPSKARAGPSKARAGPSKGRAGPSKSQSGPLQIFRRGQLTPLTPPPPPGCATAVLDKSIRRLVGTRRRRRARVKISTWKFINLGEIGATPKLLSLDIKMMGKEITGLISDGVCWKPRHLPFKDTKQFPKIFFRLGAGAKNTENGDFSALPRNCG